MDVTSARERFRAWVDENGVEWVATLLSCDRSHVSHIRRGVRTPSLEFAARIERATHGWAGGQIFCSEWAPSDEPDNEASDAHGSDVSAPPSEAA